ncbi:hypothetical protein LTR10_021486 [Elasticomyces elasticus]|uniref:Uncharacterized protein n=1 Tax=Exophiala sideris TaxID=1016849 RepID=A0ABR0J9B4_9EURO|nr:hypothetical protein LTR10_021486 [Elasticomyces elasticus]KAK5027808.1 hypothetical protein LTS07_006683 [Exophiala sideris]KAK5037604.1 hypothetical protein LTR13_004763 [Exophiala sideris]KAK5059266.1 hypothetical protein LTR69_006556 [Exophiala sideris]KAK5183100.1 hypothetical protein LTR44_004811 [Eurotiomycetes sp. CCFEE 6388]
MRRKTRGALLNIALFCGVLLVILYLNGGGSASKSFAWRTIRYKFSSASVPKSRGICPGLADTPKPALVVARVEADRDTKWLDALGQKYHLCIYTADAPVDATSTSLQVPENRGHEAMAYLTFIIDNYKDLSFAGAVFVHGSRWSWHNDAPDYDNAALLAALNVSAALAPLGYHNLRCDWSASTCPASDQNAQGSLGTSINAMIEPWNQRLVSDAALPRALVALFGGTENQGQLLLGRNDAIRSQCCAQFVVSRESVWQHSREEYIALRQWLLDGSSVRVETLRQSNAAHPDDRIAGRILSYVWHILFLRAEETSADTLPNAMNGHIDLEKLNYLACPTAEECYCRLYGRCNLDRCTAGRCAGQYEIPPGFRLPADWAEKHS